MTTPSIYESTFAPSDKTDAILVVDGKKLHVNKALLSYYSDYFNTLFNSDFKEKSQTEIEIKDVNFEEFATLLSLVQDKPIVPTAENAENLLKLADRFLLPAAKRHLELFLLSTEKFRMEKIRIADKYDLVDLLEDGIKLFEESKDFDNLPNDSTYQNFSLKTKVKLFHRMLDTI